MTERKPSISKLTTRFSRMTTETKPKIPKLTKTGIAKAFFKSQLTGKPHPMLKHIDKVGQLRDEKNVAWDDRMKVGVDLYYARIGFRMNPTDEDTIELLNEAERNTDKANVVKKQKVDAYQKQKKYVKDRVDTVVWREMVPQDIKLEQVGPKALASSEIVYHDGYIVM